MGLGETRRVTKKKEEEWAKKNSLLFLSVRKMSSTTATATAAALDDNKRFLSTMDHVIKELTPHFRQAVKEGAMTERTAKIWILREAMEHAEPDIAAAIAKDKGIELSGETLQRAHFLLDQWLPTVDLQCKVKKKCVHKHTRSSL